jgi:hypothetical protein
MDWLAVLSRRQGERVLRPFWCWATSHRHAARGLLLLLALFALLGAGCAPMVTVDEDGRTIEHHFGYVRVLKPPKTSDVGKFRVEGLQTYGLRVEDGIGVGFFQANRVYVPLDCRFVAIVANQAQFEHLLRTLSHLEKDQLCVAVSPTPG